MEASLAPEVQEREQGSQGGDLEEPSLAPWTQVGMSLRQMTFTWGHSGGPRHGASVN